MCAPPTMSFMHMDPRGPPTSARANSELAHCGNPDGQISSNHVQASTSVKPMHTYITIYSHPESHGANNKV